MKTLSIAIITIFVYGTSFAQGTSNYGPVVTTVDPPASTEVEKSERVELGDLKGPRAKNFPKYKYDASQVVVEAPQANKERLTGPEAKNNQPWEDARTPHTTVSQNERKNLKGPRAKNRKPWDN